MSAKPVIAYFSMEIGLQADIPTYSGGLGILAGDTIRAAADLKVPMVAFTLVHHQGYFSQSLTPDGWQTEKPTSWKVASLLKEMSARAQVSIENRKVEIRAWRYEVQGASGFTVPVFFLDTDLPENTEWDRKLTHYLYGGDQHYRFCQEVVLGIGGVRMLQALGMDGIERYHMNEGHASLLAFELLDESARKSGRTLFNHDDIEKVRRLCVFTTHTPVPAGHDQFPFSLVQQVLGRSDIFSMHDVFCCEGVLNMTYLALNLSHYVNGVAKKHGEVSQHMFPRYSIDSITNGVDVANWASKPFQELFNHYIPGWQRDNFGLRNALNIPKQAIWRAHEEAKKCLFDQVEHQTGMKLDVDSLTIGFARRMTTYKRADLIFHDLHRLQTLSTSTKPLQIIFAGKAHPQDKDGKEIIKHIYTAKEMLKNEVKIAYLENYDMALAKILIPGVDVWLNTPQPPLEASGTSGMKAAVNGVPSLSILDGWWIEGCIEGVTGWSIGTQDENHNHGQDPFAWDASQLYEKLEKVIIPTYYDNWDLFLKIMRDAIALNASFFNTQRMLQQYVMKAYFC